MPHVIPFHFALPVLKQMRLAGALKAQPSKHDSTYLYRLSSLTLAVAVSGSLNCCFTRTARLTGDFSISPHQQHRGRPLYHAGNMNDPARKHSRESHKWGGHFWQSSSKQNQVNNTKSE